MSTAKNFPPIHIVPFSHLDLFWTGTREECLSRGNAIIARALDLLEEHESFRFLIETMNFLAHYVDCYPQDKPRIARLAQSGRLELGPLWCGIYLNLPGGETLARNAMIAKRYAREQLGVDPQVAHFGDLPGYSPQYPQIAKQVGIRHVVMSRGGPASSPLFAWQGLDGEKIVSYFVPWGYALFAMHSDWHHDYETMASGRVEQMLRKELGAQTKPCLVHWGSDLYAPNDNLAGNVARWNQEQPIKLTFSTLSEFFDVVRDERDMPVLRGELPSLWPNIESTWPHVWPEDLPCEAALQMAEFLATFCLTHGWDDYPHAELDDAWRALLDGMDHNQNCQGGPTADRDKLQLKKHSRYVAERIIDRNAWRLAAQVPVPDTTSFPVVIFNDLSWRRSELVHSRAGVFGDVRSCDIGAFDAGLKLVDDRGNTVPYVQLGRYEGLSVMMNIAFHADVPAAGFGTYYLVPGTNPIDAQQTCTIALDAAQDCDPSQTARLSTERLVPRGPRRNQQCNTYESPFHRMSVDVVTGEVTLSDIATGATLLERMCIAGVEERRGNYISDMTVSGRVFPSLIDSIETLDNNAVWCRVRIGGSVYGMPFTQTITLMRQSADVRIENEIDWREGHWVRLQQLFASPAKAPTIRYGVPYGMVTYPETMSGGGSGQFDEISSEDQARLRLCRHWLDIGDDASGVTIASDHRMWEFEGSLLRSYMVRGTGHCGAITRDAQGTLGSLILPPSGKYRFAYTIRGRNAPLAKSMSYRAGWELNRPPHAVAVCGSKNTASLGTQESLFDWSDSSMVVTAIKRAEESSDLIVRGFESSGTATKIAAPVIDGLAFWQSDLLERRSVPMDERCGAFEIRTLKSQPRNAGR